MTIAQGTAHTDENGRPDGHQDGNGERHENLINAIQNLQHIDILPYFLPFYFLPFTPERDNNDFTRQSEAKGDKRS